MTKTITNYHHLHHALMIIIDALNGRQTISVPPIQVTCLKIVSYPAVFVKVKKTMTKTITNYHQLHHALTIIIDALNGQQTINAPVIQVTCLKIVNYPAALVKVQKTMSKHREVILIKHQEVTTKYHEILHLKMITRHQKVVPKHH
jgi:hypothetical protein